MKKTQNKKEKIFPYHLNLNIISILIVLLIVESIVMPTFNLVTTKNMEYIVVDGNFSNILLYLGNFMIIPLLIGMIGFRYDIKKIREMSFRDFFLKHLAVYLLVTFSCLVVTGICWRWPEKGQWRYFPEEMLKYLLFPAGRAYLAYSFLFYITALFILIKIFKTNLKKILIVSFAISLASIIIMSCSFYHDFSAGLSSDGFAIVFFRFASTGLSIHQLFFFILGFYFRNEEKIGDKAVFKPVLLIAIVLGLANIGCFFLVRASLDKNEMFQLFVILTFNIIQSISIISLIGMFSLLTKIVKGMDHPMCKLFGEMFLIILLTANLIKYVAYRLTYMDVAVGYFRNYYRYAIWFIPLFMIILIGGSVLYCLLMDTCFESKKNVKS